MFSRLSHQEAGSPVQKGASCLPDGVERHSDILNGYQESVTADAIVHSVELFPHFTDCPKAMGKMIKNHRLPLAQAGLCYWSMFLAGLLLVLLFLTPVVAADKVSSVGGGSRLIPRNIQFSTLSVPDGLSQATVNAIAQDGQGFIWFGTQEGLNRYDGYEFKVYEKDSAEPHSLSHDWVWTVYADNVGRLWVGTDGGGLSRYQPGSDNFTHFRHNPDDPASLSGDRVRVIYQDRQGVFWIGTDGSGLNRFNPEDGSFVNYRHDPTLSHSLANDKVLVILEDEAGAMWIGTDGGGLARFDRGSGEFFHYRHDKSRPESLSDDRIRALYEDRQGQLWVGTYSAGVDLLNPLDGSFKHFQHDPANPYSLSHNEVRSIYQDLDGTVWVATDGGLDEWRPDIQGFLSHSHDPANAASIANDRVISVFQDRGSVLWVGTYKGVSRWNYISDAFTYYQTQADGKPGLSNNLVTGVSESPDGLIWVGTYGGGVDRLDPVSGHVVSFQHDPTDQNTLSDNRVMTVFADKTGDVWIGTRNAGLNRLNTATGGVTHYRHDPEDNHSLSADGVTSIYGDKDGALWVGTYGGGLNRLDLDSGKFTVFRHDPNDSSTLSSDRVLSIVRGRSGVLWLGTEDGGLNGFNEKTGSFTQYGHDPANASSLGSDTAWEILEGRDGSLWIATRDGGLNRWLPDDRKAGRSVFSRYGKRQGLVSNTLHGILEDEDGVLWLSSNRGLSRFNPANGNVRHFDKVNGLQGNEFNFGARLRSTDGSLFFGGTDGLVKLHPSRVRSNPHPPSVAVTAFLHLAPVASTHSTDRLPADVTLGYRDYSINFEFTALDYTSSDKNQYRYRLEGFENEWHDPGRFRRATYTNLPAGNYTFKVKGSNNDGVWGQHSAAINLRVTPPPWKTGLAYTSYFLLALGLVLVVVRAQVNKLKQAAKQREVLEQQVQLRTQELAERNKDLEHLTSQLEKASVTDPLTGLNNRRYLHQYIESEIAVLDRTADGKNEAESMPVVDIAPGLSFMMIDLDGFKPINDTYGHHAGDLALKQVRDILQTCCRKSDTIVRWGGDEFFIIGRHASRLGAEKCAERIRVELAAHSYQVGGGHVARLSASIGVTMFPFAPKKPRLLSWEQVATIADQAAYLAKDNGRNAWVGLYGTRRISSDDLYERLNTDMEGLVNQGMVEFTTSIESPLVISNRTQQKNA
jgi:diguanylate cyclase (GGDEF)-like protein